MPVRRSAVPILVVLIALLPASLSAQQPRRSTTSAVITLRPRNAAGPQRLLHDLYDPTSPRFHQFLTPQQFAARFAPLPAGIRSLIASIATSSGTTKPAPISERTLSRCKPT